TRFRVDPERARAEYVAAAALRVDELEKMDRRHVIPLLERAAALEPQNPSAAYALYLQLLPVDERRAVELDAPLEGRKGNALGALERARRAEASGRRPDAALPLAEAVHARVLHRPLFATIPSEIRASFLSS